MCVRLLTHVTTQKTRGRQNNIRPARSLLFRDSPGTYLHCATSGISLGHWSRWPSRPIRSLRYIVTCTRIRALGTKNYFKPQSILIIQNLIVFLLQTPLSSVVVIPCIPLWWFRNLVVVLGSNLGWPECWLSFTHDIWKRWSKKSDLNLWYTNLRIPFENSGPV